MNRSIPLQVVSALVLCASAGIVHAQAPAPASTQAPGAPVTQPMLTPAILGVVSGGTPIELVNDGFEAVEGPLPQLDGGLLFTNGRANRVLRLAPDGSLSVWFEGPGGVNALTRTPEGDIVATLTEARNLSVLQPGSPPRLLVGDFEGMPLNRPNDLVADQRGNIYFSDTPSATATGPAALPASVYQLTKKRRLVRIAEDIARPNGVALSPDERTLYVANTAGPWVEAIQLDRSGDAGKRRDFARLVMPPPQPPAAGATAPAPAGSGADGIAVDERGRVYVASTLGVQVFSEKGEALGIIAMPRQPQNLAFAGPNRSTLFVVGRGAVYRIPMLTRGPPRTGK
jgi:gluconolactonase